MVDNIAALITSTLSKTLPLLNKEICSKISFGGDLFYEFIPVRKKEIFENILKTDLDISVRKINPLIRMMYRHQIMNMMEFLRIKSLKINDPRIQYTGLENFDKALEKGKGGILVTAHFGNWEYLGAGLNTENYPLHSMVRHQTGKFDEIVNDLRRFSGNQVFDRNKSGRKILSILKNNGIVGILADQHTDNMGFTVPFLGRVCKATGAPIAFALKSGAPVIPAFCVRKGFEQHEIIVLPEMGLEKTGNKNQDIHDGTIKYTKIIENFVRKYPEQWFWFHRRWRN